MKLYIIRINGGFDTENKVFLGPEAVCVSIKENKLTLGFVTLENVVKNPNQYQLLMLNEEEKKLYNEFQFLGDDEDTQNRTLKTLTAKEWGSFLNKRIGCFIQLKSFELF